MALPAADAHAVVPTGTTSNLVSDVLVFLLVVVVVALVGGFLPALVAAVGGSLLLNYYFTPPLHTFAVNEGNNVLALGVFVAVALLVSSVVDLASRRTRQAARSAAESETLATLAGSVLRGEHALQALLDRVRESFSLTSVTLLEGRPRPAKAAGHGPGPGRRLVGGGRSGHRRVRPPRGGGHRRAVRRPLVLALRAGRCTPTTSGWWAPSRPRPRSSSSASV